MRVSMSSNPALTGGCAGYSHSASVINVDSNEFAPWAGSDAGSAALVMAHELGHFLGLGEAGVGSGTIMNNPWQGQSCYGGASSAVTRTVQTNDANMAGNCIFVAHQANPISQEPPMEQPIPDPSAPFCYGLYRITSWYQCSQSSCSYLYSDMQLLSYHCQ